LRPDKNSAAFGPLLFLGGAELIGKAWGWFRNQRKWLRYGVVGALIGSIFGLFFGGIGVAARGGAIGLYGWCVFGSIGFVIGIMFAAQKADK